MINIYSLFYLCLLKFACAENYRIFISNQANAPYSGSEANPFSTLYSAFDYVVSQYNSSASPIDEFHFTLVPANISEPFYLTESEISNGQLFKGFLGENFLIFLKISDFFI